MVHQPINRVNRTNHNEHFYIDSDLARQWRSSSDRVAQRIDKNENEKRKERKKSEFGIENIINLSRAISRINEK